MRMPGRADGVDGRLDVAVAAILETHGHGESRGELAVDLALHGARADGRPGDEVGVVLPEDGVEKLGRDRQAETDHVEHQLPGEVQPLVDPVGVIEVRVVDKAFPAEDGAGLFEVDPHHEK